MKKYIILFISLFLLQVSVSKVNAQFCTGLLKCSEYDPINNRCIDNGWNNTFGCSGASCTPSGSCDGGCEISENCSISGGGGGGGGGGETAIYSCPAGTIPDWNQISIYQCWPWSTTVSGDAIRPMTNGGSYCLTTVCSGNEPGDPCRYSAYEYATCVPIVPPNYDPIGFHNGSDCVTSYGWTCDQNDYNTPISVDLYADGAGWGIGTLLGRVTADIVGGPELEPFCGGTRNHVFSFNTPPSLIDGIAHTIYAFAINNPIDSNHNPLLTNSPVTMLCTPTCTVDLLPSSSTIAPTAATPLTASITASFGDITQVNFSSSNAALVSVSAPGYDIDSAYSTTTTANSVGSVTITADVVMAGAVRCSDTATVTVTNPGRWWQVKDGDVTVEDGGITSAVPSTVYFNTDGNGGFPGVPTYYNGSLNYGSGLLSSKNWSADTQTVQSRRFDYSYFNNLIPSDFVSPTTYSDPKGNYVWTKVTTATHTLPATNFASTKNVLFVNGNLNITGNITLNDGAAGDGFFVAIVSGNITVDPTVTNLEGIYLSNGTFSTGLGTTQLQVRGTVASYGGINLQRNLSNNTQPAELFTFAPDQIALFPEKLGFRRTRWTEVAP